jgi:hypothetical protein
MEPAQPYEEQSSRKPEPVENFTSAGYVRPLNSLGRRPELVDCHTCEYPRWTVIKNTESEETR